MSRSTAESPRRAAVYVRISLDRTGGRLGVTRQATDCRRKAKSLGWQVVEVYEDNDQSASTTKPRPAYSRMLTAIEAGTVDAVVVWDLDRLHRRPIELERFLDLADRRQVALASVGGDVDLATSAGRLHARIMGNVARHEIEHKSERQRAANRQHAEAGRPPGGRRPFGYTRDGTAIVDTEAAEIRKAADALIGGASLRSIVRDLTDRAVTTTPGGPWRPTQLRRLLVNPRYAGQRVYQGQIIGPAAWPAILDDDTAAAVRAVLADPSRHRAGRPRRHLLSGIARCATCGGRLFGVTERHKSVLYRCESRVHVNRRAGPVDNLVLAVLAERLARPDAAAVMAPPTRRGDAGRLRHVQTAARARLDALAEAFADGTIDRRQLRAGTERLNAVLADVDRELAATSRDPVLTELVTARDVAAAIERLRVGDIDRLRAVIDLLVTVTVEPPGRGARVFDPATVHLAWRTS